MTCLGLHKSYCTCLEENLLVLYDQKGLFSSPVRIITNFKLYYIIIIETYFLNQINNSCPAEPSHPPPPPTRKKKKRIFVLLYQPNKLSLKLGETKKSCIRPWDHLVLSPHLALVSPQAGKPHDIQSCSSKFAFTLKPYWQDC